MIRTRKTCLFISIIVFSLAIRSASGWTILQHPLLRLDSLVGFSSHVGAAVGATAELAENWESVHHGHGMLLLCGSRACMELNVLREAMVEEVEDLHKLKQRKEQSRSIHFLRFFLRLLTTPLVSVSLSLAAIYASTLEVMEDIIPGGHHGAVLLAFNELLDLVRASKLMCAGRAWEFLDNRFFRLFLAGGALLFALIETVGTAGCKKLGGHHGVAILAFAKTLRCVGLLQGRIKQKEA